MQSDSHLPFSCRGITLSTFDDVLDRAHAHVHVRPHGTAGGPTACLASQHEVPEDVDSDEQLLEGRELLRAARQLVEWLLTLAHRLAGDAEESAAVDRLRAAFHSRLAGRSAGVRLSDMLIVFAVLVGALDPDVIHEGVSRTIADGVATLLTYEGVSLAAQLAQIANSLPATLRRGRGSHRRVRGQRTTPL